MNLNELINKYQIVGAYGSNGKEFLFEKCPFCEHEKTFSINVDKGVGQCFHSDCQVKTNIWKLSKFLQQEEKILANQSELETKCQRYVDNLMSTSFALQWCVETRKWAKSIVIQERIGLNDAGTHIMFPLIYKGKVIQFKAKPLDKEKDNPYWEPSNRPVVPFGVDSLSKSTQCLVVEGEPDRIAALSYGVKVVVTAGGYTNFKPEFKKYFNSCEKIYISFDTPDDEHPDEAQKGQKGAYQTASLLDIERCYNVILPMHDMNECLIYGVPKHDIYETIRNAKPFSTPGWTCGLDESFADVKLPPALSTGLENLDEYTDGGFRYGLHLIGAESGVGKTSIARYITYLMMLKGTRVGFMPFERGKPWYLAKMKQLAGKNLDKIRPFMFTHDKKERMYRNDDEFLQELKNMIKTTKVKIIFIDDLKHLFVNFVNRGHNEWQEQTTLMIKLQDFADNMEIPIVLLTPFNKAANPKKGSKELPSPVANDVAGSANIFGSACGVYTLQRNYENNQEITDFKDPNLCRLWVLKNRDAEKTGPMKLYYQSEDKHFKVVY